MQGFRFGEFELDLDALQLRRNGEPVRLERRPLDLLVFLASRPGRMVPREDLIAELWPRNVIIDFDSGLNTLVRKVRNALGDSSEEPHFIETVPGRGYRFVAPVSPLQPAAPETVARADRKPPARRLFRLAALPAIALVLAVGLALHWWPHRPDTTRIAVLPFENLSGSAEFDYLALGLAEETSVSFGQIDLPGLRVIGGVSARALAGSGRPIQEPGRELGIDYIVESSLRAEQSRIRVTSRLLRVADGEQVWSASFDRELTNVLGMQQELSVAIAEQVRQRLSPAVTAVIDRRQTENPVAYDLFLKGRYEWTRLSPIERALDFYKRAVAEDPGYALAWAGIAHALITSPMTADREPAAMRPRAREALEQALRFGPELAEVHHAVGMFQFFMGWNLAEAEASARRSLAIDPNNALAHMLLGLTLNQRGSHVDALAEMRRARELDPLFPLIFANSAYAARVAGDLQSAVELARQAIAINPEFWPAYYHLGEILLDLGDHDGALEAFARAEVLSGGNSLPVASLGYALALTGQPEAARDVLARLRAKAQERYVSPWSFAVVHTGLDEIDAAFEWLARAEAARDVRLLGAASDPKLERLRADPRFGALMARSGLAPGEPDSR